MLALHLTFGRRNKNYGNTKDLIKKLFKNQYVIDFLEVICTWRAPLVRMDYWRF